MNKISLFQTVNNKISSPQNILKIQKNKLPNISPNERKEILEKNQSNYDEIMFRVMKNVAISVMAMVGIISCVLTAIYSGKCDKFLNNIFSLSCKPINIIKDLIQNIAKSKKLNQINFDKARKHIHQENIVNDKGLVNGAHEIKNFTRTLTKNNGNIVSLQESKTQNGIWEFFYEINNKTSDTPKTVYLEEELSNDTIESLKKLCKKHNNKELETKLIDLIESKKTCNNNAMITSIEKALKEGSVIRGESLVKSTYEAKRKYVILSQELKELELAHKKAEEAFENTQSALEQIKKRKNFDPKSEEFQRLLKENKETKRIKKELSGKFECIKEKQKKQQNHYNHIMNSVNIYGEDNGRLYAAFAHYENNDLIVDSYFPISHGSKMQNEYLETRARDTSLTLLDFKYLIGAGRKHVGSFVKKFDNNLKKAFPNIKKYTTYIGFSTGIVPIISTNIELKQLNKEREREKTKILSII